MSVALKLTQPAEEAILSRLLTIKVDDVPSTFISGKYPDFCVPFAFGTSRQSRQPIARPLCEFPSFRGQLRAEQEAVFQQAKLMLATQKYCMISCYTGFGKTITTIALACAFRLKTIIVCHRTCLYQQWTESLGQFTEGSRVVRLPDQQDADYDFGIINISSIHKWSSIPDNLLLITDETHLLLSEKRSKNLLSIRPRKFLGLTATPYRPDELHALFRLFFGTNYIYKPLFKVHNVYQVNTNLIIDNRYVNGKLDWNYVLEQQCDNDERNKMLLTIVRAFPKNRTWLVLVKRKRHAVHLETLFGSEFKVSLLIGNRHSYDTSCNILIGTVGKIGTGFDFPTLDSLLIATDMVEYYIQFLGRVMRTCRVPVVVDVVDSHPILQSHFQKRKKVYLQHGGRMCSVLSKDLNNPHFKVPFSLPHHDST